MLIRKIVKWLNIVVTVLTVVILIVVGGFSLPRLFNINPYVVLSGSMEPTIATGSVVFVNQNDTGVEVGDIITFGLATGADSCVYVTHRVKELDDEKGLIQTKGDNNDDADGWLEQSAVLGTVAFHIPKLGLLLNVLQEFGFVFIAIWVLVINVVTVLLSTLVSHKHHEKAA